jgi:Flp pilus assembly pilin Flp
MSYFNKVRNRLAGSPLARDEAGLSTVEYVIILVLIAAIGIGTWKSFGNTVKTGLQNASDEFDSEVTGADIGTEQ